MEKLLGLLAFGPLFISLFFMAVKANVLVFSLGSLSKPFSKKDFETIIWWYHFYSGNQLFWFQLFDFKYPL